jgi:hypothetical protein
MVPVMVAAIADMLAKDTRAMEVPPALCALKTHMNRRNSTSADNQKLHLPARCVRPRYDMDQACWSVVA